ncbi:CGNR zinc finger domain-containing protein [Dactylosporangium sp. NPDC049140]|uniref:CGNR zinc finger domain-containing protein n=1 Tax=Dactylosporangium sp. NPDC049140 TaxID=3155647 RepID=UPI0033FFC8A6
MPGGSCPHDRRSPTDGGALDGLGSGEGVEQQAQPGGFLDTTRNHSRRWCDPDHCGNRARVRAYSRRRRAT